MELEGRRNEQVKELWGLEPYRVLPSKRISQQDFFLALQKEKNFARRFKEMGLHDGDKIGIEVIQFSSMV